MELIEDPEQVTRWHIRLWAKLAMAVAVVSVAVAVSMVVWVASRPTPYNPISFVNPALFLSESQFSPELDGYAGAAALIPKDGETPFLPIFWLEQNDEQFPVETTFSAGWQSFDLGITILQRPEGTPRPAFEPGVHRFNATIPLGEDLYERLVRLRDDAGICASQWSRIGSATPVHPDGVTAPYFSESIWLVWEGCEDGSP